MDFNDTISLSDSGFLKGLCLLGFSESGSESEESQSIPSNQTHKYEGAYCHFMRFHRFCDAVYCEANLDKRFSLAQKLFESIR